MTVRQLLGALDSAELTEWMGYDRLETIGDARADLRAGIIASAVANHGSREIKEPYKAIDFMPFLERGEAPKPILIPDKEKQSALILSMVFNRR
jgi:hypothetical protein